MDTQDASKILRGISSKPLLLCPDLPQIARRWEAWWRFEADRPLLRAATHTDISIRWDKGFDLFDCPEKWVALRRRQVESMRRVGEELPAVRVDIGPVAVAAFLGAPLHLGHQEQTTWQDAIIREWSAPPSFKLDPQNDWYRRVVELHRALARDAAGNYLVCCPDMSGGIDVLSNMRGPDRLCLDLFDHRDQVKAAALEVVEAIDQVYWTLYGTVLDQGAGFTQWLGCWSEEPFIVATCDFNALIGQEDFRDVCMPALHEQARRSGRCVFHLDGPAAARHVETLAQDDAITAIQYVPGAGTPSALAKLDVLRCVQKARKPLMVSCLSGEVEALCGALDPRGLVLWPWDIADARAADRLLRIVESHHG